MSASSPRSAPAPLFREEGRREALGDGVRLHHPASESPASPASSASKLLEAAQRAGFVAAGLASTAPFPALAADLEEFIQAGHHGSMTYLSERDSAGRLLRLDPGAVLADASTALVVALPYALRRPNVSPLPDDAAPRGAAASYAGGRDYHHIVKERLLLVADELADHLGRAVTARVCVDSAPLLERHLAHRAGLGFLGKHTLSIIPGIGSAFVLGVLLITEDLPHTSSPLDRDCGTCQACIAACPTAALLPDGGIDARRCVSYLTIEHQGVVPDEFRSSIGNRVFGCDACQTSCPYNASRTAPPGDPDLDATEAWREPDLVELLFLGSARYRKLVRHTAMSRASRHQISRNAAIALGNTGSAAAVSPLERAIADHPSPLVREHAAWALVELARTDVRSARLALARLRASQSDFRFVEVSEPELAEEPADAPPGEL